MHTQDRGGGFEILYSNSGRGREGEIEREKRKGGRNRKRKEEGRVRQRAHSGQIFLRPGLGDPGLLESS